MQILAPVEQDFSIFFFHRASENEIPGILSSPDLRISRVCAVSDRRICDRRDDNFFAVLIVKVEAILRGYHKLC